MPQARKLVEMGCIAYVFTLLAALAYLHYWYVFPANQPSCLALQTASAVQAAGGLGGLDRMHISLEHTEWGDAEPSLLSPTPGPDQLPGQGVGFQFTFSPDAGILDLSERRARRLSLREAYLRVPMLPAGSGDPSGGLGGLGGASLAWFKSLVSGFSLRPGTLSITLPCQPPAALVQPGPWAAPVRLFPDNTSSAQAGRHWHTSFAPAPACKPVRAQCTMGTPLGVTLLGMLGAHDPVPLNAITAALTLPDSEGSFTRGQQVGLLQSHGSLRTHHLSHGSEVRAFTTSWDRVALFKLGSLISAVFIQAATSVLVSYILSETQARMMRFTLALQRNVRSRRPLLPLIVAHSASSLVFVPIMLGVLFFLFEFFGDQLLAFLVLLVTWFAEVYGVVSVRTTGSLEVFPRVVFLLMLWFHVYYLSFPFGFHYICLHTVVAGLFCAVWHLWARHELPALLSGRLTQANPRDGAVNSAVTQVMMGNGVPFVAPERDAAPAPQHVPEPPARRVRYAETTAQPAADPAPAPTTLAQTRFRYDDDSELAWASGSGGEPRDPLATSGVVQDVTSAITRAQTQTGPPPAPAAAQQPSRSTMPAAMAGGTGVTPQLIDQYFAPPTRVRHRPPQASPAGPSSVE